ncbi:MAG: amidohydrolase family protein, partial [Bacillota bacterium]
SEEGKVYKEDGTLAGSTLTLEKAVQNIVKNVGIPVDKAVRMASLNPARMLEIDEKKGSLKSGKDADFIVLDEDLSVEKTYIQGQEVV